MTHTVSRLLLCAVLAASGCAGLSDTRYYNRPTLPIGEISPADGTLACLKDRLVEAGIQPALFGYYGGDVTGKTGVDLVMPIRGALHRFAPAGIRVTSLGQVPTGADHVGVASPGDIMLSNTGRLAHQAVPSMFFEFGVIGVNAGALQINDSGGVGGTNIDFGAAHIRTLNTLTLSAALKDFNSGIDFPGAIQKVTVTYAEESSSAEGGGFLKASFDGHTSGLSLRLGRSVDRTESLLSAVSLAIDTLVAELIANHYQVNLAECARAYAPEQAVQSAARHDRMTPAQRLRWVQEGLAQLGYRPGVADGVSGPLTLEAISRFHRDAGMPLDQGGVSLALFTQIDQKLQARRPGAAPTLSIALEQPLAPLPVGRRLRASAAVTVGGHVYCYRSSPEGIDRILPVFIDRPAYITARTPAQIPDPMNSGPVPSITVRKPGLNEIFCIESYSDASTRIEAELRRSGARSFPAVIRALQRAAGSDRIAEASTSFQVVKAP